MSTENLDIVLQGLKEILNNEDTILIKESPALMIWMTKIMIIFYNYLILCKRMIQISDIDKTIKYIDFLL